MADAAKQSLSEGPADDPWNWTVDDVVSVFCRSRDLWNDGRPNAKLPDPTAFESALREQDVDGATLLSYITAEVLEKKLNIKSAGQLSAIEWAIQKLRRRSRLYQTQHGPSVPAVPAPAVSTSPEITAFASSIASQLLKFNASSAVAASNLPSQPQLPIATDTLPAIESAAGSSSPQTRRALTPPAVDNVHLRPNEVAVEGPQGQKRRRLDLSSTTNRLRDGTPSPVKDVSSLAVAAPSSPPSHLTIGEASEYLGKSALPMDSIFFGDADHGEPVKNGPDLFPADAETEHLISFSHWNPNPGASGRREYVYRCISRFLRDRETETVNFGGENATAVFPYRDHKWLELKGRSALIFRQKDDGDVEVVRNGEARGQGDEWGFLDHWSHGISYELPPYNPDGDEEEYPPSLIAEIEEEEEAAKRQKEKLLTEEQVQATIDGAIQEFVRDWETRKKPRLDEQRAWALWNTTRHRHRRTAMMTQIENTLQKIDGRLKKLREGIIEQPWTNEKSLLAQCASLELTVFQRQEELWKKQVMDRTDAPQKPPTIPRHHKRVIRKPRSDADESESLGSDSEAEMAEFVAPSEANDEDIPVPDATSPSHWERESPVPPPLENDSLDFAPKEHTPQTDIDSENESLPDADSSRTLPEAPPHETPHSVIDLTVSSDAESFKQPDFGMRPGNTGARVPNFRGAPGLASDQEIAGWDWLELEEREDRKRLIIKVLHEMSAEDRAKLSSKIQDVKAADFMRIFRLTLEAISLPRPPIPGRDADTFEQFKKLAALYGCWTSSSRSYWLKPLVAGDANDFLKDFPADSRTMPQQLVEFHKFVRSILVPDLKSSHSPFRSAAPTPMASSSLAQDESSSGGSEPIRTPSKRRRPKVAKNLNAMQRREKARLRQEEQQKNAELLDLRDGQHGEKVIVNTNHASDEGVIYLHPSIARRAKAHQIKGIQFMWREIVAADADESPGCLLAHTMGLGKTMQAIALIVTIAEAANSNNPNVREQVPKPLRRTPSRVLILCPVPLIPNWRNELDTWIPASARGKLGEIRSLTAELFPLERLEALTEWYEEEGILVMGYQLFRQYAEGKPRGVSSEASETARRYVLQGPRIVIADEAHTFKASKSSISAAVAQIKTKYRIALTGSPLNNNLLEYYNMINWVSENWLGDKEEFNDHYKTPIEEGLWAGAGPGERRRSYKMLRVLKDEIDPKVHRVDITALKGQLKPKLEFVITVPLTPIQKQAYTVFANAVLARSDDRVSWARLWGWLSWLSLLCNHPLMFADKTRKEELKQRTGKQETGSKRSSGSDGDSFAEDEGNLSDSKELPAETLSSSFLDRLRKVFEGVDLSSAELSSKVVVLNRILGEARKVGDKVLIFSHSIPTLDYLQVICERRGFRAMRIDGKTKPSERLAYTKGFNESKDMDLFFVSTRAGGVGLNITGANRVVIFDFAWNPAWEEQAVGRAYRIGQEKPVFVYHLITGGTWEPKMKHQANFKTQLAYTVVDKKNVKARSLKPRQFLQEPEEVAQEDLHAYKGIDTAVLDHILDTYEPGKDFIIRAITSTETLMEEEEPTFSKEEEQEIEAIKLARIKKQPLSEVMYQHQRQQAFAGPSTTYVPPFTAGAGRGQTAFQNIPARSTAPSGMNGGSGKLPVRQTEHRSSLSEAPATPLVAGSSEPRVSASHSGPTWSHFPRSSASKVDRTRDPRLQGRFAPTARPFISPYKVVDLSSGEGSESDVDSVLGDDERRPGASSKSSKPMGNGNANGHSKTTSSSGANVADKPATGR